MDWAEIGKIAASALAALGAIVAVTRYVTHLQDRVEFAAQQQDAKIKAAKLEQEAELQTARHELETRELQDKLSRLTEENQKIEERYRVLRDAGHAILALKLSIDEELNETAERLGAEACSILVPAPSVIADESPQALVFLSLFPENPELRSERIPFESVAGHVLQSGKSLITENPISAGGFSSKTDKIAHFKTSSMLATPLFHKGRCVGVAEYLNKRNNAPFDFDDQDYAEQTGGPLGHKVGEFTSDPRNLKSLGFTPRQKPTEATILVSDISNSSQLAQNLDTSVVIDLMNQYFEALCDVGLRHGGTIDQLLGDGFMMTFNVKRPLADHRSSALKAAVEMQQCFQELKQKWTTLQYAGMPRVHNRIGLTSGPVHKAELGHSQFRQITVLGDAVNTATHLCQAGTRERNVIIVGEALYRRLDAPPPAAELTIQKVTKDAPNKAFELAVAAGPA